MKFMQNTNTEFLKVSVRVNSLALWDWKNTSSLCVSYQTG